MKVYILDQQFLSDKEHEQLKNAFTSAGHEILFREWKTSQEVIDGARDADAIILMAVQITREVIEALPNLKVISRCGIGYDNVDWRAATEHGVVVCNVPDHCIYEVACHTFTMLLALERQLIPFMQRAREGGYANGKEIKCHRVKGQTLGILGYGRIGRELAPMALGVGMKVLAYDPYVKEPDRPGVTMAASMDEVLRNADAVSIHLHLNAETAHMISMPQLRMMKKSAFLLNASRGGVVNTEDLMEALKTGEIAGAGLDVIENEPLRTDHEIFHMPQVIFTPHVGMYTEEAMEDMYNKLSAQALDVLAGRWPNNVVNPEVREKVSLQ
ncbi:C-terminal binding protein [Dysosmobacter sp. NSJ-60]|nr:C-terminal binding protein [Dysosmobacter hominis]MBS5658385.1 C-terminal binding protein [Oscillibacter sp.]